VGVTSTGIPLAPPGPPGPWPTQVFSGPISYFKRFKMEIDLARLPCHAPVLPAGFSWVPWCPSLIEVHAEVLYDCFCHEVDAIVFASLGDRDGCRRLMTEITRKRGFLPGATWLLASDDGLLCGTVQGIREPSGIGAIQNLGILPDYRGRGLGGQLLLQALAGFRQAGLARGRLEVTAQNDRAVRLYRALGFRRAKTIYKAVSTPLC
jgi:ribosomal protein S18 acetylase RimI-like enzyme